MRCLLLLCAALGIGLAGAAADDYPSHSIRLVVPFAPGGAQVRKLGYEEIGGTPEPANARIKTDVVRWTKIIHDAGIEQQ
jgi:tripartite-type tricarboxylate transporter receptor subunit TctC